MRRIPKHRPPPAHLFGPPLRRAQRGPGHRSRVGSHSPTHGRGRQCPGLSALLCPVLAYLARPSAVAGRVPKLSPPRFLNRTPEVACTWQEHQLEFALCSLES